MLLSGFGAARFLSMPSRAEASITVNARCGLQDGSTGRICFLMEHKSRPSGPKIYPQLLRYLANIQENDLRQKREAFTVTIPIVFYHGERPWNLAPLLDQYGPSGPRYADYLPLFNLILVDLQQLTREEILAMRRDLALRNFFLAMKMAWDDAFFLKNYREFVIFVDENLSRTEDELLFEATFIFIQKISKKSKEEIMEITAQVPRKYKKRRMTVYEQILEEGMEKGIEKGIESMVLKYSRNYPEKSPADIAALFEIPEQLVTDILAEKSL